MQVHDKNELVIRRSDISPQNSTRNVVKNSSFRRIGESAPISRSPVVMDYEEEKIFGSERINHQPSSKVSWR
ncbi:hypothetical protein CEXT_25371 [Caerostris extrusa]|uniref:Uncharacterized protein n=1 Tax=Caerostris extrusa TaxID=172846 RepID=A0AAV4XY14_CAEEX|nr:hypothetical protein CEXT_25371 [Caerostris extrusa]